MRRSSERRLRTNRRTNRKWSWLNVYSRRWNKRGKCCWRKEDRKENTFKRCLLRMKGKRPRLLWRKNVKDRKISELSRNTQECLRNKNKID
jgi:hypothetical protein